MLCTTECGLEAEADDRSAARLAQLIIGYVGGYVRAERDLISIPLPHFDFDFTCRNK